MQKYSFIFNQQNILLTKYTISENSITVPVAIIEVILFYLN